MNGVFGHWEIAGTRNLSSLTGPAHEECWLLVKSVGWCLEVLVACHSSKRHACNHKILEWCV